jgi:hypothetical protein
MYQIICLLSLVLPQDDSLKKQALEKSEFQLLGGWRITGEFSRGGIAINHESKTLYVVGHAQRQEVYEFDLPDFGKGVKVGDWPALKSKRVIPGWWQDGYANSLVYHDGKLWAAVRKFYDTSPPSTLTLFALGGESRTIKLPRQQYSGFVKSAGQFPELGCGGYESGQGSAYGPTLATLEGKSLIAHDFNNNWDTREKREPNYFPVGHKDSWLALEPREVNGKKEGRWACDRIYGGGVRLKTGIYYWPQLGIGDIDYARQCDTFAATTATYQYRYDPETYKLLGWEKLSDLGPIHGQDISPDGKLLYLSEGNAWKSGLYQVDPVVRVYQIK